MRLVDEGRPERLVLAGADGWGGVELPAARSHRPARTRRRRDASRPLRACPMRRLPVALGGLRARRRRGARRRLPRRVLGLPGAARGRRARGRLLRPDLRRLDRRRAARGARRGQRPVAAPPLTWEAAARALSTCGGSSPREHAQLVLVDARHRRPRHGRATRRTRQPAARAARRGAGPHVRVRACATRPRCPTTCRSRFAGCAAAGRVAVPADPVRASRASPAARGATWCTSSTSSPRACRCPSVVTVHDLSFARRPELCTRRDRMLLGRFVPGSRAPRPAGDRGVGVHARRSARSLRRSTPRARRRDPERRRGALRPDLDAAEASRGTFGLERAVRAVRRRAAAAQERAHAGRGVRPARGTPSRARARRRRPRRPRERCATRGPRALGLERARAIRSATSTEAACPGSTAPPSCSPSRRCTRGSAYRRSRRWPAGRPSAPAPRRGSARRSATPG